MVTLLTTLGLPPASKWQPYPGAGGDVAGSSLSERRTQRVEARSTGESVFFDGAPDRRRHCGELLVGQIRLAHPVRRSRAYARDRVQAVRAIRSV